MTIFNRQNGLWCRMHVPRTHLPVRVEPIDDEAFTSWWRRVCIANALTPNELRTLVLRDTRHKTFTVRLHLAFTSDQVRHLEILTRTDAIAGRFGINIDLNNRRSEANPCHFDSRIATSFCPACWREDAVPFFRRIWLEQDHIFCPHHHCNLVSTNRCCHFFNLGTVAQRWQIRRQTALHHCVVCGKDLREQPTMTFDAAQSAIINSWQEMLLGRSAEIPIGFAWGNEPWVRAIGANRRLEFAHWIGGSFLGQQPNPWIDLGEPIRHRFLRLEQFMVRLEHEPVAMRSMFSDVQRGHVRAWAISSVLMKLNPLVRLMCWGLNDWSREEIDWGAVHREVRVARRRWQQGLVGIWSSPRRRETDELVERSWQRVLKYELYKIPGMLDGMSVTHADT